jgi:choline-sulfatase
MTSPTVASHPNILFILSDQHAQRMEGCDGGAVPVTSHLDALAARGVCFETAYCPAPICTGSLMSLITGCWPFQ